MEWKLQSPTNYLLLRRLPLRRLPNDHTRRLPNDRPRRPTRDSITLMNNHHHHYDNEVNISMDLKEVEESRRKKERRVEMATLQKE